MNINERLDKLEKEVQSIKTALTDAVSRMIETPAKKEPLKLMTNTEIMNHYKLSTEPVKFADVSTEPVIEQATIVEQVAMEPADQKLALVDLLKSDAWPHAVDPTLICDINSEQDKEDRAEGILDLIIEIHLEGLKFLDFGCGEGHVINRSKSQKPKLSVGYDIKKFDKWDHWEKSSNSLFTTNWNEVKSSGPYNIILMYDVIDHILCDKAELITKLKEIKGLLAAGGKIFVRTHPFCSRHGTHLYHQINKAYAHMVFTEEELDALGYKQEPTRKIKNPIYEYDKIFSEANLKIHNGPHQIKEGVEPFFINTPIVAEKIKSNYKDLKDFPVALLESQFVDYVLM